MFCPTCNGPLDHTWSCPNCGRLSPYASVAGAAGQAALDAQSQWQHSPWGRMFIGILLAQGLAHGLQLLCNAGLLAAQEETRPANVWTTLFGLVMLQALQGVSILIAGALTGAGQRRGLLLGAVVGLVSGILFVLIQQVRAEAQTEVALYGQPVLCFLFGALGGQLGSAIWRPLPKLSVPSPLHAAPRARPAPPSLPLLSGPVAWSRVLVGVIVVVCGVVWPSVILDFMLETSQGKLRIQSQLQAQLVTWEIAGLLALIGGGLAGATTRNGLKQGICVGLGAGAILVGRSLASASAEPEQLILLVLSVLALTLVGGWFGGQLFPPVVAKRRDRVAAM
jgi:hypothetical protein